MTREITFERYLVTQVKAKGGEVRKVKWIGRNGAPDRIVMLPDRAIWVELKAPGGKCGVHQIREHERMRRMGQRVEVVDSLEGVDEVLRAAEQNVDRCLDVVLRAAGMGLRHYSTPKTINDMRAAMGAALRAAAEAEREACAALCDSKVMALDHGGKEYYRPAPADQCAAAIRARANSAEGLV